MKLTKAQDPVTSSPRGAGGALRTGATKAPEKTAAVETSKAQPSSKAKVEDAVEAKPKKLEGAGARGDVKQTGKPLLGKTSPMGAFFAKEVKLPSTEDVADAITRLPLSAYQPDVDALFALGDKQGRIKNGKLDVLSLEIPDRRLHALMTAASFDVALGVTREQLLDVMRRATDSRLALSIARIDERDGAADWAAVGATLSPRERDLVAQAMASTGVPLGVAKKSLDNGPEGASPFVSKARVDVGIERAAGSTASAVVRFCLDEYLASKAGGRPDERRDPFIKALATELENTGGLPLPAGPAGERRMLAAAGAVLARDYADDHGVVDARSLSSPGKKPRVFMPNTQAFTLVAEIQANTIVGVNTGLRQEAARELEKVAVNLATCLGISVEDARKQVMKSLVDRNPSDGHRSLVEDAAFDLDNRTWTPIPLEHKLLQHARLWNAGVDAIPQTLPMVERAKDRIPDDAFRGHLVLTVQHFLGPFVPLMNALKDKGAETKDMIHVGVPYSANTQVELVLSAAGNDVRVPSTVDQMKATISAALEEIIERSKKEGKPILVIDDGGTVTELLQEKFPNDAHRICIIEQTTRGITAATKAIEKGGFVPPVIVDVARSYAKSLEGVQIAPTAIDSMIPAVAARANSLRGHVKGIAQTLDETKPVVFGFGVIGASMARALKERGLDVAVWDRDPALRDKARAEGFFVPETRDEVFKGRDLVVGCTGFPSIEATDIPKMEPYAMALSLSSKRIEFESTIRDELVDMRMNVTEKKSQVRGWAHLGTYQARATLGTDDQLARVNNHSLMLYNVGLENRPGPIIVNDMQPINFDHDVFVVPADRIQLTESLLLDGAYQAVLDKKKSGIVDYDKEREKAVLADWAELEPKS
jgi:S-adenosylhomocysteine hydrolase